MAILTPYEQKLVGTNSAEMIGLILTKYGVPTGIGSGDWSDQAKLLKKYNYDTEAYYNAPDTPQFGGKLTNQQIRDTIRGYGRDNYGNLTYQKTLKDIALNEQTPEQMTAKLQELPNQFDKDMDYRHSESENNAKIAENQARKDATIMTPIKLLIGAGLAYLTGTFVDMGIGAIGLTGGAAAATGDVLSTVISGELLKDPVSDPPGEHIYSGIEKLPKQEELTETTPDNPFTQNPNAKGIPDPTNQQDVLDLQDKGNIQSFDSINKGGSFTYTQAKGRPFGQASAETAFLKGDTSTFDQLDENGKTVFRWS